MINLNMLKSECKTFLSKLKDFNRRDTRIDDEFIKILYEITLTIDDCYAQNQMVDIVRNENVTKQNGIDSKGSQKKCDVCNVYISGTENDFAIHVNGRSHQMRCEEIIFTNNAHSSATASSNCCIPNSNANNDEHDPPIEIAVNGRVPDNYDRIATGGAVAVNNLPDSIVFRRSSIIGLNGNHLPSNNKADGQMLGSDDCHRADGNVPNSSVISIKVDNVPKSLVGPLENTSRKDLHNSKQTVSGETSSKNDVTMLSITTGKFRLKMISENVKKMFPHEKLHIYGSQFYQLSDDNSDVNIYVAWDNNEYYGQVNKAKMSAKNVVLDKRLHKFSDYWKNIECDFRNNLYPVVKAVHKTSAVKYTFSFANGLFVEGSKRLTEYIEVLPMIRGLVVFLKEWQSGTGKFHFSSYQLTILVLWYFQYRKYVPSIQKLQNGSMKIMCGGAQVNFNQPIKLIKPVTKELEYYAVDFFDIFGNKYVPERDIICPHFGKLFHRKIDKMNTNIDGDHLKLLNLIKNAKKSLWNPPNAYMYVHDIFLQNLCPNITTNITQPELESFQAHCRITDCALKLAKLANQN